MSQTFTIVAISKDEGRYLPEWLAFHFSIGVDRIIVYDNDSSDNTKEIFQSLENKYPFERIEWPSVLRISPQRSAYKDAINRLNPSSFVCFIDIDEFLVPWGYTSIPDFIAAIPSNASAVVANWRCFGSSGLESASYESVIETFVRCSSDEAGNNKHVKSIARVGAIVEPLIHTMILQKGDMLTADFKPAVFISEGKTIVPIYEGLQINHYQTKTYEEFSARMARGNANFPAGHPSHGRDGTRDRFAILDRNEIYDDKISKFLPKFRVIFNSILESLKYYS